MRNDSFVINGVLAAAVVLAAQGAASAAVVYTSQPIYLTGSAYTVSSSFAVAQIASNGVIAGTTNRSGSGAGRDAWLYNPNNNSFNEIGLFDASGTGIFENGIARVSAAVAVNASGQAAGNSNAYAPGTSTNGEDAWYYNPVSNTSINIGLQTPVYQAATAGYYYSTATGMNSSGVVIGTSYELNGGPFAQIPSQNPFKSAWFYNPAAATPTTTVMGFTGSGYTSGGLTNTAAIAINSGGQAVGTSTRYDAFGNTLGQDAWIESTSTAAITQIGLTGAGYQASDGTETSTLVASNAINDAGDVVGTSTRYSGFTSEGLDGWIYTPTGGTVQIGLTGAGYENSGFRQTSINFLNSQGQVAGTSFRYSNGSQIGQDAWYYDSTASTPTTIPIGLTGGVYDQTVGGVHNVFVSALSSSGQVAGTSTRYSGSNTIGADAWLYTPNGPHAGLKQIGLTGPILGSTLTYTRASDGTESSSIASLNNTGMVAGSSTLYSSSGTSLGQNAWVYDSNTDTTYTLDFSSSSVTGATSTTISYLSDSGIAVGFYTKYSAGTSLGNYAFEWSEGGGFIDLSSAAITPAGIATYVNLAQASRLTTNGSIIATGVPSGASGTGVYFLTAHLLGDANGDNKVDLSDLNIVLNNLGTTSSAWTSGNFDGAATIDLTDLNDVLNNLGTGAGSSVGAVLAAPEPASLCVLGVGAVLLMAKKRRDS